MDTKQANALNPTAYASVNAILRLLLTKVQTILGQNFVGLYLHGSLAMGDFNLKRSDIDFLVVTNQEISDETLEALKMAHDVIRTSHSDWSDKLEGPYVPQAALRRFDPSQAIHPWLNRNGRLQREKFDSDWLIQLYILREYGICVAGPDLKTLIDPVEPVDLKRAQLAVLHEWWLPQLEDHKKLQSAEYQSYAILTMARALYTLRYGAIVSKPKAAEWTQETLGEPWAGLIRQALGWERGKTLNKLDQTLDFIRFTLKKSREFKIS